MGRFLVLMAVSLGLASAYLKSFDVAPTHYGLSGTMNGDPQYGGVAETFIANFDSAAEVHFFVGDVGPLVHYFNVEIRDHETNALLAYSDPVYPPAKGHVWLHFPMTPDYGQKIVRGKEYVAKVTRPGENAGLDFEHSQPTMS